MAGVRAQKKKETKEAIRAAAFRLFDEQGFHQTSIEDIAKEAGIGKTTIYGYFTTKEDIFRDFCRDELHKIFESVEKWGGSDRSLIDNLSDFFMMEFHLVTRDRDLGSQLMREAAFPAVADSREKSEFEMQYLNKLRVFFGYAVDRGEIRALEDFLPVILLFRLVFTGVLSGWFKGYVSTEEDVRNFMKTQFQLIIEGISR
jgi:AcrR family transcriptional regulator